MSGLPTTIGTFARVLELQKGLRAQIAGNEYDVYRINGASSGDVVQSGNLVYSIFPMLPERTSATDDVETNWLIKVPLFNGICDPLAIPLAISDVLVETGDRAEAGNVFTFVGYRAGHISFFVGTPFLVTFTRPDTGSGGTARGEVAFGGGMRATELSLVLADGVYSWQRGGSPSPVYIGFAVQERGAGGGDTIKQNYPEEIKRQTWHLYAPPSIASLLQENDVINGEIGTLGDRYYIRLPFEQAVGIHGGQFVLEKAIMG